MSISKIKSVVENWLSSRKVTFVINECDSGLRISLPNKYLYFPDRLHDHLVAEGYDIKMQKSRLNGKVIAELGDTTNMANDIKEKLLEATDNPKYVKTRSRNPAFTRRLEEALDGIAADFQPQDILDTLITAIKKLGLSNKMRRCGIKALVTKDRQFVTFVKETGGEKVRLLQVATQSISKPKDLETVLINLSDIADGKAPGASKLKMDQMKQVTSQISNIAKSHAVGDRQQQPDRSQFRGNTI